MSDCYCDYDQPEFYRATIRAARKPHKCEECSGTIRPGEKYEYVSAKWDGRLSQFHTCERCVNIRTWVQNNVPCFCFAHGGLDETATDAIEDAYHRAPKEVVGLYFGYLRRKVERSRFNALPLASNGGGDR